MKKGNQSRDSDAIKLWRVALPGVPDNQIVLPRYLAKDFAFPPADCPTDDPRVWQWVRWLLFQASCVYPLLGKGRNAEMRRFTANTTRRALRWWDSLGEPTRLKLNQSLYPRRDRWKNILDFQEFYICYALCQTWMNLPSKQRTAANARARVLKLQKEVMTAAEERGEVVEMNRDWE